MTEQDIKRADFVDLFSKVGNSISIFEHLWEYDDKILGDDNTESIIKIFDFAEVLRNAYVDGLEKSKTHLSKMFNYIYNGGIVSPYEWRILGEWRELFDCLQCNPFGEDVNGTYRFETDQIYNIKRFVEKEGLVDDGNENFFNSLLNDYERKVENTDCYFDLYFMFVNFENHHGCASIPEYEEGRKAFRDDRPMSCQYMDGDIDSKLAATYVALFKTHPAPHADEDTPDDGTSTAAMEDEETSSTLHRIQTKLDNAESWHQIGKIPKKRAAEYLMKMFDQGWIEEDGKDWVWKRRKADLAYMAYLMAKKVNAGKKPYIIIEPLFCTTDKKAVINLKAAKSNYVVKHKKDINKDWESEKRGKSPFPEIWDVFNA